MSYHFPSRGTRTNGTARTRAKPYTMHFLVAGFMVSPHWFGPEPASAAGVPAVKAGNYANLTRFHMRF